MRTETGFSQRLHIACDKAGIISGRGRVAQLHRRWLKYTGKQITLETIRRWLAGETMPTMSHATQLADMLGVSSEALLSDSWTGSDSQPIRGRVPVIPPEKLGDPMEAIAKQHYTDTVETTLEPRKSLFAAKVEGDSMQGEFVAGSHVVLDAERTPHHNDYVLAWRNGSPMLRQYREEGGDVLLVPANERYPIHQASECAIQGVVRQQIIDY